jgi:hypothetical protein
VQDKFIIRQDQIDMIKELVFDLEDLAGNDPAPLRVEEGDYDDGTTIMRILNLLPAA